MSDSADMTATVRVCVEEAVVQIRGQLAFVLIVLSAGEGLSGLDLVVGERGGGREELWWQQGGQSQRS